MNPITIIQDKKLGRKPPIGRFTYEFLQTHPTTKQQKWIKSGLSGSTYLNTVLSSYVRHYLNFKFEATRNATLTIPYGYKTQVQNYINIHTQVEGE